MMALLITNPFNPRKMLPNWPGASEIYSKLYRILEVLARQEVTIYKNRRGVPVGSQPSERMTEISKALDTGDEEKLKGFALQYGHFLS